MPFKKGHKINLGRKRPPMTVEHKRNIGKSLVGKNKGKKKPSRSKEHSKNLSKALKGKKKAPFTEKHKKHLSEAKKGIEFSEEHKVKLRKSAKMKPSMTEKTKEKLRKVLKGKTYEEIYNDKAQEEKEKRSRSMLGKNSGPKSGAWRGGISFEPYSLDWTETLRRSIRERDNYICQLCSQYGNVVHHIDYNKKNCNPDNLITLCRSCNARVNSNREYWQSYFQNKLHVGK